MEPKRYKLGVVRRPDGRYEFADTDADGTETWDRETVEAMAQSKLGKGRLRETVDGIFWQLSEDS